MSEPRILDTRNLPANPLDAANLAARKCVEEARTEMQRDLVIVFDPADHTHDRWRLALVQELAREAAPRRVNAIVGDRDARLAETLAFLASAPGITGQIMQVDGNSGDNR